MPFCCYFFHYRCFFTINWFSSLNLLTYSTYDDEQCQLVTVFCIILAWFSLRYYAITICQLKPHALRIPSAAFFTMPPTRRSSSMKLWVFAFYEDDLIRRYLNCSIYGSICLTVTIANLSYFFSSKIRRNYITQKCYVWLLTCRK